MTYVQKTKIVVFGVVKGVSRRMKLRIRLKPIAAFILWLAASAGFAAALDEAVLDDTFLNTIAEALGAYNIDVASNLNDRDLVSQRIQYPRLGRFPDLPMGGLATSPEIESWEMEYRERQIGGLAIISIAENTHAEDAAQFLDQWLQTASTHRLFVSFYREDRPYAQKIDEVVSAYGYDTQLLFDGEAEATAGNLYATAAQRLAIDSGLARRYRSEVTELDYLGRKVRRNSNSLFSDNGNRRSRRLARTEPSVFLKETLGDEFTRSTIWEMVVPGGVALGETAKLAIAAKAMQFEGGGLQLVDEQGVEWQLPALELKTLKALFDFVERSRAIESDAIVDIDAEGRVKISSALRDTDAGYEVMHADTQPFKYVQNLAVNKSVVIDIAVDWVEGGSPGTLEFGTAYEVRFLSADNMRIAQTRVALEYQYDSVTGQAVFLDTWGQDVSLLDENLDYTGLGKSMVDVANYAGWVGLFRKVQEDKIPFLHGRYQFMKIDKRGRNTPVRY